ncbi:15524_t:CDS:2 [Acaulospora morrowiae]|uniref:15524_t:CDS:1 n=1 Tax=Acaulospora morrowiae TaxID=94023 RepID=A0A9N8V4Z4_9GLOM|nr:15524_t:CDS:2 [Acaulospora morrowiae]
MQAITYQEPFKVLVKTVPLPQIIEPTDAIVKISSSGLCGSDLHRMRSSSFFFHFEIKDSDDQHNSLNSVYRNDERGPDKDTIMGHEFVGTIHQIGSDVNKNIPHDQDRFKIGDRVLSPFTTCCGEASQVYGVIYDGHGINGAQAEYIRVPLASTTLVKVPSEISDNLGLLLADILSTGYFCAENGLNGLIGQREIKCDANSYDENDVLVVVGCGPVGLMTVVSAVYLGAKKVYAIDSINERLMLARDFGAIPLHLDLDDPVQTVKEATGGRGADVVMEVVGNSSALELAYKLLRPAGMLSSVGVHNSKSFPFSPTNGYDKNITYKSGRCPVRRILERTTQLVLTKRFDLEKIITHEMKLCDGEGAYNIFDKKLDGCVKVATLSMDSLCLFFFSSFFHDKVLYTHFTWDEFGETPFFCPSNYFYGSKTLEMACKVRAANLICLWAFLFLAIAWARFLQVGYIDETFDISIKLVDDPEKGYIRYE